MKANTYLTITMLMIAMGSFTIGFMIRDTVKIIPQNNAIISTMNQKSTSMLQTIQPDMEIESKPFIGKPKCGHLYIYEKDGQRILHRNVYEDNKGQYWFKGDNNNYYDEPINESMIIEEVIGIKI